jgi:hypothetical protein
MLLAAVALFLQTLAAPTAASEPLEGYIMRLERVLQSLEASLSSIGDPEAVRVNLDAAIGELFGQSEVAVPGGGTIRVDNEPLKAALTAIEPKAAEDDLRGALWEANEHVQVRLDEARNLATAQARSIDKDREALQRILASRDFQDPGENWFARFVRWLGGLFRGKAPEIGTPQVEWRPGLGTGVGATAAVLAFVLFTFWHMQRRLGGDQAALRTRAGRRVGDEGTPDPYWLADEAAARGEFREGLRNLYLGVLQSLDRHGLIRYHGATTDWEYLLRIRRDQPEIYPDFRDFTRLYERHWYGGRPALESDFALGKQLARSLHEGVSVLPADSAPKHP